MVVELTYCLKTLTSTKALLFLGISFDYFAFPPAAASVICGTLDLQGGSGGTRGNVLFFFPIHLQS